MLHSLLGTATIALLCGSLATVAEPTPPASADPFAVRAVSSRYQAGWLHRLLFGGDYRELWTTPLTIPVLDLATYGGGLTPVSRGGGQQTTSVRLRAADGGDYYLRSIDKNPAAALPAELAGTAVAAVVQDQTSATFPAAALVVSPLLDAAGVLNARPQLFILPDDPRLGEFRDLAGLVGILEPRLADGWGGATEVIGGGDLLARLDANPADRVDARAFLVARLVDLLVGDWDRHRDQWSWARFGDEVPRRWQPVPRDRDFALVNYEGLAIAPARIRLPQLITFGPEYPALLGLTWNGRELDRRLLLEADAELWRTAVADLQAALTDAVIALAVAQLPPEYAAICGDDLARALARRRDALDEIAGRFYRMLAREAEVHATDADETLVLDVRDPRTVVARLFAGGRPGPTRGEAYFTRQFTRDETRELRVYLGGGRDSVVVTGQGDPQIEVRVVGGPGADVVLAPSGVGGVTLYDEDPGTVVTGDAALDRRPYSPPPKRMANEIPPRDWGHAWEPATMIATGPDIGLLIGVGQTYTTYGFRKLPYASRHQFRIGYATEPRALRADYRGRFRRIGSPRIAQVLVRASGIEVLRFHGFGNEVTADGPDEYYRVTQNQYGVWTSVARSLGADGEATIGPVVRYVTTDDWPDRYLATVEPYGADRFGQVGLRLGITLDSRHEPSLARGGLHVAATGSYYPAWWDVSEAYGDARADVTGYVVLPGPLDPALRLHAGGKVIWGPYPYFDAAFIGDQRTVRLGRQNRYAGDASTYGSAELHLTLGRVFLGVPADVGLFGLADAGRVYLEGEHSNLWHDAVGGGLWASILDRANTIQLSVARSEERTALYFHAGFGF